MTWFLHWGIYIYQSGATHKIKYWATEAPSLNKSSHGTPLKWKIGLRKINSFTVFRVQINVSPNSWYI